MKPAAGDARNSAAPAISSGSAQRPSGVRARIARLRSAFAMTGAVSLVRTQPGAIALTRMPRAAQATANARVIATTPPLLAV